MINKNEELLHAWLRLCTTISNERITSDMPYNEALICNYLYRTKMMCPDQIPTATDLCRFTKMLKSQMNRTLQCMEEKGIITRKRSEKDRRQIYVVLNEECSIYQKQHTKIMKIVDALMARLGTDNVDQIIPMFKKIADTADEVLI